MNVYRLALRLSLLVLMIPAALAQDSGDDLREKELKLALTKAGEAPALRYQAGKDLLEFYQTKHDHQSAANTFESLVTALKVSVKRRSNDGEIPSSISAPVDDQEAQHKQDLLKAQEQESQSIEQSRRDEETAKASQSAKELAEASVSAQSLSRLHKQWADYLLTQKDQSQAAFHRKSAEQFAKAASSLTCQEGVNLYRTNCLAEAVTKFRDAQIIAPEFSREQMAAADNAILPLEKVGDADELWRAKRTSHVLHFKIENVPIPEDYDGETPDLALERKLIKHDETESLLRFYQQRHQYEKARNVFAQILAGMEWSSSNKVTRHREWADYCQLEGQSADAAYHRSIANLLEKKQVAWRKQDELRQRKLAAERARLAEMQRREEEEQHRLQAQRDEEEAKRRLAMSEEEKRKEEERRRMAEEKLKQPPQLVGKLFKGDYGGALDFIDQNNVDIHTTVRQTPMGTNFGDVPDILPGTWSVVGSAPTWTIRIQCTLKGSPRIDNYSFTTVQDGSIKLVGGTSPLPTVLHGRID